MSRTSAPAAGRFVFLALLWGSGFTLIKVALDGVTPSQLVLARLLLGAAVLVAVARLRRVGLPRGRGTWAHLAVAAALGNVAPFLLLSYGEQTTSAGLAGVLVGTTPLLTLGFAAAALPAERVTRRRVVGLSVGFVGVVVVIAPWQGSAASVAGSAACFAAALSYAVGFVYVRRFVTPKGLTPLALAAAQLVAAVGLQGLITPLLGWSTPHLTPGVVASVVGLGVLSTGVAYVLYFRLIDDLGATGAAAVDYLVPVFAVAVSATALAEPVGWNLLLGALAVLAGVAHAEHRLRLPHLPGRHRGRAVAVDDPVDRHAPPPSRRGRSTHERGHLPLNTFSSSKREPR